MIFSGSPRVYTSDNSRVGRKTSGEFAQRTVVREHKRIPKFDTPNLELSEVYLSSGNLYGNSFTI